MNIRIMVTVRGLVQGINFRHYTRQAAQRHHVSGWVRNLPDGRVEGCFEGDEDDVNALVAWCRCGPPSSRVEEVAVEEGAYRGEFTGFEIRY